MTVSKRSMAIEVEDTIRMVFLQKRCLNCPTEAPSCPQCKDGEVCAQVPATCDTCASTKCVPLQAATNTGVTSGKSSGSNVGAIAGGVVAGVAAIAIITFLVYWFFIRGKRQQEYDQQEYDEQEWQNEKPRSEFDVQRSARASTHTVASMASTVLTRASNVIQIAYIPGVTQRNGPGSPGLLVPPVPPIPMPTSQGSDMNSPYGPNSHPDALYFDANDIRDSTYSDMRSSYARTSMAPSISPSLARSSVATTIFRGNAVASPVPAQTIVRGKAAVVSVKSSNSSSHTPESQTPPVPQIDFAKHSSPLLQQPRIVRVPSSTDGSVRSFPTVGRPIPLTINKGKASTISTITSSTDTSSSKPSSRANSPKGLGLQRVTEGSSASAKTHDRARASPIPSEASLPSSDEDSDEEAIHARSRRSLLAKPGTTDRSLSPHTRGDSRGPSPFGDENRI